MTLTFHVSGKVINVVEIRKHSIISNENIFLYISTVHLPEARSILVAMLICRYDTGKCQLNFTGNQRPGVQCEVDRK